MCRCCWGLGAILRTEAHRWVVALFVGHDVDGHASEPGMVGSRQQVTQARVDSGNNTYFL